MEYRMLGRTNLRVSALGFGCGNVGGLMIRGTRAERERAVARALDLGVNFFDTAPLYGDGVSEEHLGEALQTLKAQCLVATKVRAGRRRALADPAGAVTRSLETSLRRLRRDRVDLLQLHDPIRVARADGEPGADEVLERILPAFETLRRAGKIGFVGMTAIGDTPAHPPGPRRRRGGLGAGALQPAEPERRRQRSRGAFPARTSIACSISRAPSGWGSW